jgi:uncharacterized protein (DUF2147 family)
MLVIYLLVVMLSQTSEEPLAGNWRNPSGSVIIAILPCGDALCGRVEWASNQATADARRGGTDSLIGAELLSNFVPTADGRWRGRLFVPDANKRSKAELRQLGPDRVEIVGCVIGGLVCKSQVWTRVGYLAKPKPQVQ